jgi:hypothetical protein
VPENARPNANNLLARGPAKGVRPAELPAVVTFTVAVEDVDPLSLIELGETEHVDPVGPPLQLRDTVWLNPPDGLTLRA